MKLFVLDTNIYIYYLQNNNKSLSPLVKKFFDLFDQGECIFYIPTICFWEINRKIYLNKLKIKMLDTSESLKLAHETIEKVDNFRDLPLSRKAASIAPTLSIKLPDPFDQLIVASALDANLPLITKDVNIQKAKIVQTVW